MCGALVVAGGVLGWRLARGPISLDRLIPWAEQTLQVEGLVSGLRVGALELAWDSPQRRLELRASHLELLGVGGAPLLVIPRLALAPHLLPLLWGRVAPARLDLIAPRLDVVLEDDHHLTIGVAGESVAGGAPPPRYALADLLAPRAAPTSFPLEWIGVRQGALAFSRRDTGARLEAAEVGVRFRRIGDALSGSARVTVLGEGERLPPVDLELSYRPERSRAALHVGVRDLVPSVLAPAVGRGSADDLARILRSFALPVGGTVDVLLDHDTGAVRIERASITIEGMSAEATAQATPAPDGARLLHLHATMARLPVRLLHVWPEPLATEARRWVLANISEGRVRGLTLTVDGAVDRDGAFTLDHLRGRFGFEDLRVRYLDSMLPVTGVSGVARISRHSLGFAVTSGVLNGITLPAARVGIQLTDPDAILSIDARVRGPVARAITVLEAEPVRIREMSIISNATDGTVDGRIRFRFPLKDDLALRELGLSANGRLTGVRIPDVVGWPLDHGSATLTIDKGTIKTEGQAQLAGVPTRVSVVHPFGDGAAVQVEANARLDRPARIKLGLDPGAWLDGPVDARVRVLPERGGIRPVEATLDLRAARLRTPLPPIDKPPGTPARAQARLDFVDENLVGIEQAVFSTGPIRGSGRATRTDAGQRWGTVDAQLTLPGSGAKPSPAQVTIALRPAGKIHQVQVATTDAGALLGGLPEARVTAGTLTFDGTTELTRPEINFTGRVEVLRPTVREIPWLTRLATLTSLSGMVAALSSREGLRLDVARGEVTAAGTTFVVREGTIRTSDGVNLLVDGSIAQDTATLDLRGSVIPPYFGLNTAPGHVPLLGTLYDKATGGGIGGIEFAVSGVISEPQVSIRPLATLAPGVLRRLLH